MGAKAKIELDLSAIRGMEQQVVEVAEETMEVLHQDLVASAVMPYDQGDMQNNETFVVAAAEGDEARATLVTGSPQARRLYYHPEYNFQTVNNANAGAEWLEAYISGDKTGLAPETFAKLLKERLGNA
ncbi:hypothetical protein LJB68_14005 [bacterium 210820-DFI.6.52]|uniref:Minor capsid protein n=1 Tax=Bittarella massiliensis (ex Durand et al. 2017) TaxID=1720313 RepID=A0AAQ1MFD8_9FIRM|nr:MULTISPECIES: hypothetical protein [Eubacteriales]ERJ00102.1 hypothetical protein HMPREF0262_01182 [Clostridium sp. ATCC 29733]MCB5942644.1 hypothetical protein [bacterium 210820-DFI.6.52]SHG50707.1 hypothetical protein SAMN05444424_2598 [Bittarella massiliensis (ex Durand et al. 2017)]